MNTRGKVIFASVVVAASMAAPAYAQSVSPAAERPAPIAAPVVVHLKNGGLLRGTISELKPGESVIIVTVAGETRRFGMDEVAYAGPAAGDHRAGAEAPPAATTTAPSEGGPRATVHLASDPPGLVFYKRSDTAVILPVHGRGRSGRLYERLCTAPCSVTLAPGIESLSLAESEGTPSQAQKLTIPRGESEVVGHYESRSDTRIAGGVLLGAAVIANVALMATAFHHHDACVAPGYCVRQTTVDAGNIIAAMAALGIGLPFGLVMVLTPDEPKLELRSGGSKQSRTPSLVLTAPL